MFHPWHDHGRERVPGRGLDAFQTTLFDQIIAELSESKRVPVITQPMSCYVADVNINEARTVVVTTLNAETNCPADNQCGKVRIRKQCRSRYSGQNIQSRNRRRIAHQRKVNNLLDPAIS